MQMMPFIHEMVTITMATHFALNFPKTVYGVVGPAAAESEVWLLQISVSLEMVDRQLVGLNTELWLVVFLQLVVGRMWRTTCVRQAMSAMQMYLRMELELLSFLDMKTWSMPFGSWTIQNSGHMKVKYRTYEWKKIEVDHQGAILGADLRPLVAHELLQVILRCAGHARRSNSDSCKGSLLKRKWSSDLWRHHSSVFGHNVIVACIESHV